MKIDVDNKFLFELTDAQIKIMQYDIAAETFDDDMKRRLQWVLMNKYENCLERIIQDWMPILKQRFANLPTSSDSIANIIMQQPDYKDKSKRDKDKKDKEPKP